VRRGPWRQSAAFGKAAGGVGRRRLQANSKPDPNLAKSSKIHQSPAKDQQRKRLGFPWILLAELSLFKDLR
jgi:hypothetical protein